MLKVPEKSNEQTGTEILLEAMSKDKVHLARFVLDALDGEIVDSKTEGAQTPLISSVLLPDVQTRCKFVELLLHKGASVNYRDGNGRTALSHACEEGYLDVVKILVRNNADPEIVDSWGNTALMYAAVAGQSPVVDFLVKAFKRLGLQIDRKNKVGNSAVEVAKFLGHVECIFSLTNNSKKSREADGGALGNARPRLSLGNEFESKVEHFVNEPDVLQTCNHRHCPMVQNCTRQPRPRMKQSLLTSMDSIEEFERENDDSSRDQVFSGVPSPIPPPRTCSHSLDHSKPAERLTTSDDHLPPLRRSSEVQKPIFVSLWARKPHKPSAPSSLGILLTPIPAKKSETDSEPEKSKTLDFGVRRFHDSYYKKRCSLPVCMLSPTPPERTLLPLHKTRTVRRREASPSRAEPLRSTGTSAASAAATFSVLSNKLLRRFTSPEFQKDVKKREQDPVLGSERIPRSETFPQSVNHPRVDSKPSIDSISSVECEFDCHFRKLNS